MRSRIFIILFVSLLAFSCLAFAQADKDFQFLKNRVSEKILTLSTVTENSRIVAISTQKGLVMIDSMWSPSIAEEAKKTITEEFGREDYKYLINTSGGDTLSRGNQAFPEALIIAHEDCKRSLLKGISSLKQDLNRRADEFQGRIARDQKRLDESGTKNPGLQNWINLMKRFEADMRKGYEIVLPSLTFKDQISMDMGDLTIELIYFGIRGGSGNILVKVPEQGFIFLGDIFHAWHVLPVFGLSERHLGVERWISVLDDLLKDTTDIKFISRSNGSDGWSVERLQQHRDLIYDIKTGVEKADAAGMGLNDALDHFSPVEEKFPCVKNWDTFKAGPSDLIEADIRELASRLWRQSHDSAAYEIAQIVEESGIPAAAKRFSEIKEESGNKYYFLEAEFNSAGYRLLNNNKINKAIAIFQMNVELFANSANVYDSLGEAYMKNNETELAIKNYKKSLELNPENNNAKEMLKRLEKK